LKIYHLDFLSVMHAPCFQEDYIRKHIKKAKKGLIKSPIMLTRDVRYDVVE